VNRLENLILTGLRERQAAFLRREALVWIVSNRALSVAVRRRKRLRMSTAKKLFGRAAKYLELIDEIVPIATSHDYEFVSDEWFSSWARSEHSSIEKVNHIIMHELLEKSHLAAITAVIRASRWADAVCRMYEVSNFVGWAASFRGLLESAGDTVDGLSNIPTSLARNYQLIARSLAETEHNLAGASELEHHLDHFVHAKWARKANGVLQAKQNVDYIKALEQVIPNVVTLYHKLCAICHPSSGSIDYSYDYVPGKSFRVSPSKDSEAISAFYHEHSSVLHDALMLHCNPPLLTLRVLHKFRIHPRLKMLRKLDWDGIKVGPEIEDLLFR
jgi:hypothetical protein